MPRTEMSEQVVLLVEVKGAYKAFEGSPDKYMVRCKNWCVIGLSPLLMESLHVSQQQSSLRKCLRALRTLTCFQLVSMFACSVLFILPFQVKHFMAFFTREAPVECFVRKNSNVNTEQLWNLLLHMELLMLVQLCQRGKGLVTNGTKELHSTTTLRRRFLLRYSSGWTLQVWLQLLAQIPPRQVFLLQTTFSGLQLILRAWGCSVWATWFFHTSSGNLNNNKPVMRKTAGNGKVSTTWLLLISSLCCTSGPATTPPILWRRAAFFISCNASTEKFTVTAWNCQSVELGVVRS